MHWCLELLDSAGCGPGLGIAVLGSSGCGSGFGNSVQATCLSRGPLVIKSTFLLVLCPPGVVRKLEPRVALYRISRVSYLYTRDFEAHALESPNVDDNFIDTQVFVSGKYVKLL